VICTTTLITFGNLLSLVVFYSHKKTYNNNNNKNDLDMETVVYILVQPVLNLAESSQPALNQPELVCWPRSKIA
jgi:hypothetical protein